MNIMYKIKKYSYNRLDELNKLLKKNVITIKESSNKNKKIDVYINNIKTNSIGANGMNDYPTYIETRGLDYANKRKDLYHKRHSEEKDIIDGKITNSFFAKYFLW